MDFGISTYFFGFIAGMLSILSPCVLPLIPILLATAASSHRLGPPALALGLAISFAVLGTTMAAAGALEGRAGIWRAILADGVDGGGSGRRRGRRRSTALCKGRAHHERTHRKHQRRQFHIETLNEARDTCVTE